MVGQHGKTTGPSLLVVLGDGDRVEVFTDDALGRGGFFHLGNEAKVAFSRPEQAANKIAPGAVLSHPVSQCVHRHRRVGQMPQLGAFVGDDFVENVHPRFPARPRLLEWLDADVAVVDDALRIMRLKSEGAATELATRHRLEVRGVRHLGPTGGDFAIDLDGDLFYRSGVQKRKLRELRRGRLKIADILDLHGCTQVSTPAAITNFLASYSNSDNQCVMIITGKGRNSPDRVSVVRATALETLRKHPRVLAYCCSQPVDGGHGAFYILLRR